MDWSLLKVTVSNDLNISFGDARKVDETRRRVDKLLPLRLLVPYLMETVENNKALKHYRKLVKVAT